MRPARSSLLVGFLLVSGTLFVIGCGDKENVDATALDSDADGLTDAEEEELGTDPHDADTDDDSLTDSAEVNQHHTEPLDPDSDHDALSDGEEVLDHQTDPHSADSDSDGSADAHEVEEGTNPEDSADHHTEEATFCETHTCSCEFHPDDSNCVDHAASDPCAAVGGSCTLVSACPDGTTHHAGVTCEHAGAVCCAPHSM